MVQQTTFARATFEFRHIDRLGTGKPEFVTRDFPSIDELLAAYRVERRRRAYADRATGGTYKLVLTPYGEQKCAADPDCAKRHADVGTVYKI